MKDTLQYKQELENLLETITKDLQTIAVYEDSTGDWIAKPEGTAVHEADANVSADIVEDWNERRATLQELETRYNNILRALQKIEAGTFGRCEISGHDIEPDRLAANPAARTCKAHMNEEASLPLN